MAGGKQLEAIISLAGKLDPSLANAIKNAQKMVDSMDKKAAKSKAAATIGKGVKRSIQAIGAVTAAAGAGIAYISKQSLAAYADYEQLVGGVETLFKDSSPLVRQYADNAYKSAGLSANNYMETVTSFSASLLQSLGGDTRAAAEMGNMAVTDMADNANKMGSNIEDIQRAYQSLARGQYGMLDNLKLGYGGTKGEMERLIKTANELRKANGQAGDLTIEKFGDVVQAIHEVQTAMGITGTTAAEAEHTISGSLNAAKAAYQNWLVGLADDNADVGKLTNQLMEAVATAASNIIPRIGQILTSLGEFARENMPEIAAAIAEAIPPLLSQLLPVAIQLVGSIFQGIASALPQLIGVVFDAIVQTLNTIGTSLAEALGISDIPIIGDAFKNLSTTVLIAAAAFALLKAATVGINIAQTLKGISSAAKPAAKGMGEAGASAAKSATNVLKFALAALVVAAAIALAAAGIMLLVQAAITLANAGPLAIGVMVGLVAVIALLAAGAAMLGTALTAGAPGIIAFGAAIALVGVGIFLVAAGLTMVINALPIAAAFGLQAAAGLMAVAGACMMLGPALLIAGVGAIVAGAGFLILGVGALVAGVGLLLLGAGALVAGVGLMLTAAGAMMAAAPVMMLSVTSLIAGVGFMLMGAGALLAGAGLLVFGAGATVAAAGAALLSGGATILAGAITLLAGGVTLLAGGMTALAAAIVVAASGCQIMAESMPVIASAAPGAAMGLGMLAAAAIGASGGIMAVAPGMMLIATAAVMMGSGLMIAAVSLMIVVAGMTAATAGATAFSAAMMVVSASVVASGSAIISAWSAVVAFFISAWARIFAAFRSGAAGARAAASSIAGSLGGIRGQLSGITSMAYAAASALRSMASAAASAGSAASLAKAAGAGTFATGGFTSGPSIAGEDPRYPVEAVISFNPAYRAQNVKYLQTAARMLGVSSYGDEPANPGMWSNAINAMAGPGLTNNVSFESNMSVGDITFAPNINITGNGSREDVIAALREVMPEFVDIVNEALAQRTEGNYDFVV